MSLELIRVYKFRKAIFIFTLAFVASCLYTFLNVNADEPTLQNNGFILEDNMVYQIIESQVKIKSNSTNNPSGTYYRFIANNLENGDMDIISDSQSTEVVWVPKKSGTYDLYMDVYTPGDNSSKITHFLRVFVLEDRCDINNPLDPSFPVDSGFTPEIAAVPDILEKSDKRPLTVDKYIGIRNRHDSCSLDSALQLLYHDREFRELILELEGLNASEQPYLSALQRQFKEMTGSTAVSIDLQFTDPQIRYLTGNDVGTNYDHGSTRDMWAGSRILLECIRECDGRMDCATIERIKDLFYFDDESSVKGYTWQFRMSCGERIASLIESGSDRLPRTMAFTGFDYRSDASYEDTKIIEVNDGGQTRKYELQGVLMWTGTHFYSLVKDSVSGDWYRLDDTNVSNLGKDPGEFRKLAMQYIYREVE